MADEEPTNAIMERITALSRAPVGQRDTPEEAAKRVTLRMQPDDFTPITLINNYSRTRAGFKMSKRITSNLLVPGIPFVQLARPDLLERLEQKFAPIVEGRPLTRFNPREGFITFHGGGRYTITINDKGELHISTITRQLRDERIDPFPGVIEQIKEAVADVALAKPRKAFMDEKTLSRVAQSVGLNDPLAAKEIGKYLGGRRKTRKFKKTHKKTLKRHNGGRR
jgi:hypothetical protein